MSNKHLRAVNVCMWTEPAKKGSSISKVLNPGEEGMVPGDEADHFLALGAAVMAEGQSAASPGPALLAQGVDQGAVEDAARQTLLEQCREKGIPVSGDEPTPVLQSHLNAHAEAAKGGDGGKTQEGPISIGNIGLTAFAVSALEGKEIESIDDLTKYTRDEIDGISGLGDASMDRLDEVLEEHDLAWKP